MVGGSLGDLVVTAYLEKLTWLRPLTDASAGQWTAHVYLTSVAPASICRIGRVHCTRIANRGNEWAGYLTHIVTRYD